MPTHNTWSFTFPIFSSGTTTTDALLGSSRWFYTDLTYSFPNALSSWSTQLSNGYGPMGTDSEPWNQGFYPLLSGDKSVFRAVVQKWANVSNLSFTEVADNATVVGDIRVAFGTLGYAADAQAWSYMPSNSTYAGDIWLNTYGSSFVSSWAPGSYTYLTLLHELGHALGLKHPFSTRGTGVTLPTHQDTMSYTLMSYAAQPGDDSSYFSFHPTTPMLFDVAAIQHLYGTNTSYRRGNDIYTFTDGQTYHETIWDAAGKDTIAYTGQLDASIDLRAGYGSQIGLPVYAIGSSMASYTVNNVWIAYGVVMENATAGSGNDSLTGNASSNTLTGGAGNDRIDGAGGIDTAVYALARSQYTVTPRTTGHTVSAQTGADGTDTLTGVERLRFADTGLALDLNGNAGKVAKLIGAVFGSAALANKSYVATGLRLLDEGVSYQELGALALGAAQVSGADAVTRLLWTHVIKTAPSAADVAPYVAMLYGGMSAGALAVLVADTSFNQQNIQLTGLSSSGLEYAL